MFKENGFTKATVNVGGITGKVTGHVLERDTLGRPTLLQETFTGKQYRRTLIGTYEPVSGGGLFSPKR